eukprot:4864403-Amphidinium_carterae.1
MVSAKKKDGAENWISDIYTFKATLAHDGENTVSRSKRWRALVAKRPKSVAGFYGIRNLQTLMWM